MKSRIAYDITHLAHRQQYSTPSGIEKVDLFYAQHFSKLPEALCCNVHYGIFQPILAPHERLEQLVQIVRSRWLQDLSPDHDEKFQALRRWIISEKEAEGPREKKRETYRKSIISNAVSSLRIARLSAIRNREQEIPKGSIYLNIAQHALEFDRFFRWLYDRPDLKKVFFIHDLLPLDHPEYWPIGYELRFRRRIDCAITHGSAFIAASLQVRSRLHNELISHGRKGVPIFTASLPPGRDNDRPIKADTELSAIPYFVVVGTIEPRKNHALLLNVWRDLSEAGGRIPKLVIVGKRGWLNEQVLSSLDRAKDLACHVAEISGLADASLRNLISNARAVLVPAFVEGFGLPVVEALACGTPVLASDIAVFHEVSKGHAQFRRALDGAGWLEAIRQLSDVESSFSRDARAAAGSFEPNIEGQYFTDLNAFLEGLS